MNVLGIRASAVRSVPVTSSDIGYRTSSSTSKLPTLLVEPLISHQCRNFATLVALKATTNFTGGLPAADTLDLSATVLLSWISPYEPASLPPASPNSGCPTNNYLSPTSAYSSSLYSCIQALYRWFCRCQIDECYLERSALFIPKFRRSLVSP
jgi:hypothetical protein